MIQFNLLPDVKLDYIKANRTKQQVVSICIIVAGAALGILVLMFMGVQVWQKHVISQNKEDIKSQITELKKTPDLDKILTIQNQLNSLGELHDGKPVTSRLFTYLPQVTPNNLSISAINVDFAASTVTMSGQADSIVTVNKFVDTLKFTTYTVASLDGSKPAFSSVVLSSFTIAQTAKNGKNVTYSVTMKFDPVIFDSTKQVTLVVPKKITTRSETEKPSVLFESAPPTEKQQ